MLLKICGALIAISLLIANPAHAKPEDWVSIKEPLIADYSFRINFRSTIDKFLAEGNFKPLDSAAASFRKAKTQCANGEWHLSVMYEELSYFLRDMSEREWLTRLEKLQAWVKSSPQSITAKVALAECLIGYAFHGRGGNYASDVTAQQWGTFEQRIKLAAEVLKDAGSLNDKCPEWWAAYERLALGLNMNKENFDQLFDAAIADEPSYTTFYFRKAWFLLPWWNGQEGEWENFATASADKVGGREGDLLYARIVLFMQRRSPKNVVDNNAEINWVRVNSGLDLIKIGKGL